MCASVCVCTCLRVWRDHFNCFLIPAESTLNTYCLINNHCIKVCFYLWKRNGFYIYIYIYIYISHVIICSIFPSRWIFLFALLSVQNKWKETEHSRFLFFSCCTEIVSNRDPRTEVRTEPWHLCTVPPLIYIYIDILYIYIYIYYIYIYIYIYYIYIYYIYIYVHFGNFS